MLDEAVASFHKALAIKPDFAEAHYNHGLALRNQGKLDEAVASYRKALSLKPDIAETHINLGNALQELGKLDDAVKSYHKALAIKPDYAGAHSNLGIVLNSDGRRSEALDHFKRSLDLERGAHPIDPEHQSFRFINKTKMNHDIEQFRYLASLGHETERFQSLARVYEAVDQEIDWPSDHRMTIPLIDDHRQRLGDTYNRPIHLLEAPEETGFALSSTLDVEKITADYFSHASGMTYFDDLLNPTALASLRRFLLGSTIWFNFRHGGGYLGAMLKDGLSCPLLLQIADDLRLTFPHIFKNHQLLQLWAYKYDSRLTGIDVHADAAAVNVNFWITPDTANLNPASGGLMVYDVEAPVDWNFETYNIDQNRIRTYPCRSRQWENSRSLWRKSYRPVQFESISRNGYDRLQTGVRKSPHKRHHAFRQQRKLNKFSCRFAPTQPGPADCPPWRCLGCGVRRRRLDWTGARIVPPRNPDRQEPAVLAQLQCRMDRRALELAAEFPVIVSLLLITVETSEGA